MTDNEIIEALDSVGTATGVMLGYHSGKADIIADRFRELIDENNRQKAEIERLEQNINGVNVVTRNHVKAIRTQAIKEFAERLKEKFGIADCIVTVDNNDIDNLVKEMTEVETNQRKEDEGK